MQCDVQEGFESCIWKMEAIIKNSARLMQVSKELDIPVIATIHDSKKYGETSDGVQEVYQQGFTDTEKFTFNMLTPPVLAQIAATGRRQVVLYGVQAHVCILQTANDLLSRGFRVYLPVDAVSSSSSLERQ